MTEIKARKETGGPTKNLENERTEFIAGKIFKNTIPNNLRNIRSRKLNGKNRWKTPRRSYSYLAGWIKLIRSLRIVLCRVHWTVIQTWNHVGRPLRRNCGYLGLNGASGADVWLIPSVKYQSGPTPCAFQKNEVARMLELEFLILVQAEWRSPTFLAWKIHGRITF